MQWNSLSIWLILVITILITSLIGTIAHVITYNDSISGVLLWSLTMGVVLVVYVKYIMGMVGEIIKNKIKTFSIIDISIITVACFGLSLVSNLLYIKIIYISFDVNIPSDQRMMLTFGTAVLSFIIFSFSAVKFVVRDN